MLIETGPNLTDALRGLSHTLQALSSDAFWAVAFVCLTVGGVLVARQWMKGPR